VGPCGVEFRDAFSCFHYSTEEPKGKDCLEKFATMQECMKDYPELFEEKKKDGEEEGATEKENTPETATEAPTDNNVKSDADINVTKEEVKVDSTKETSS